MYPFTPSKQKQSTVYTDAHVRKADRMMAVDAHTHEQLIISTV